MRMARGLIMNFSDFGKINEALSAGKRAEAKIGTAPIVTAPAQFAALLTNSSDFVRSSITNAINRPNLFVWTSHKWADGRAKVSE